MLPYEPHPGIPIAIYRLALQQDSCRQCGLFGCNVDLALRYYAADLEYIKLLFPQQNLGVL